MHDQIEPVMRTILVGPDEHEDAVAVGLCRKGRGPLHKFAIVEHIAKRSG